MAVFAFVGAVQAALLQNGGFEDPVAFNHWELFPGSGVTGVWSWGNGTAAINTTDAYEGLACADVNVIGYSGAGVFQGVFIGGGVPVSISAYYKTVRGTGIAGGIDMVFFGPFDALCLCQPLIGRVDLNFDGMVTGGNGATGSWGAIDANGWRYGILNAVTPPGTVLVKFEIHANNNPGEFLFDNVVGSGLEADLNEDYRVDFRDFAILGNQWFQAPGYPSADISPLGGDGIVNFEDLALLADQWLEE